ncbi:MAG: Holliday junction resolvase RuvX [Opitutales bacterium]
MTFLGIDYGEKRIGLAAGDDDIGVAMPITAATEPTLDGRLTHLAAEIERRRVSTLVVGYPLHMDGSVSAKAREVDAFIAKLEARFGLPVYRSDERLTSQQAAKSVPGSKPRRRSPKQQIAERRSGGLDSRAAALILQDFLDARAFASDTSLPGTDEG